MSILDKIQTVEAATKYLKILIYGAPGAGKTTLAATAPNPLILTFDPGAVSLLGNATTRNVKVLQLTKFDEIVELIGEFREECPFETLIIDTVGEFQRLTMDNQLRELSSGGRKGSAYLPHLQDYGENNQMIRRAILALNDLPTHLVLVCHEKEDKDEDRLFLRPDVSPGLHKSIAGFVDIEGYLSYTEEATPGEDPQRFLRVRASRKIEAKTRINTLPTLMPNPTITEIIRLREEMLKGDTNGTIN